MSKTVIKVENLSKLYRLGEVGTGTVSHDLNRWWAKLRGKEDPYAKVGQTNDRSAKAEKDEHIWALQDINFELKQGELLGIIGKNGAGKSTLLKLLSRITSPTSGSIKTKGRIASLLEVGTGFHPEMTGRENVYLNGTILGMTRREIDAKFEEIMDFAGCLKYADTPVKRYSSGMKVRLGFAVAAFLEPEILVVDEVLAVGDAEFQKKAIGKMQDISSGGGRTVLFVSHNMASVKSLCTRGVVMNNGTLAFKGTAEESVNYYLSLNKKDDRVDLKQRKDRKGNGDLMFEKVIIKNNGNQNQSLQSGCNAAFDIYFKTRKIVDNVIFRFAVLDSNETVQFICNNKHSSEPIKRISEDGKITLRINRLPLTEGTYYYDLSVRSKEGFLDLVSNAGSFRVEAGDFFGTGKLPTSKSSILVENQWQLH